MIKNARWDNEVVLDYIEQHDPAAFKKHDEKVLKEDAKTIAKQLRDDGVAIEILVKKIQSHQRRNRKNVGFLLQTVPKFFSFARA